MGSTDSKVSSSKGPSSKGPSSKGPGFKSPRDSQELEKLRRVLLASVRRRCPKWLAEQSEDIVQESMTRVLERLAKTPEEEVGPGYWMQAAHHEMLNEIRKRRTNLEVAADGEGQDWEYPSGEPGPERLVVSRQAGWAVFQCLQRLASSRKQAVALYLRGYSAKDTGEVLSWPVRRVQNLVFRGLRDLRACLDQNEIA